MPIDPVTGKIITTIAGPIIDKIFGGDKNASRDETTGYNVQNWREMANLIRHENRFVDLRRQARLGGFNPLTALRAQGAGSYSTSGPVQQPQPTLGSNQFIGEAIGGALETWFNRDQIAEDQEASRIKLETMREELKQLKTRGDKVKSKSYGYDIPHVTTVARAEVDATPELGLAKRRPRSRAISDDPKVSLYLPDGQEIAAPRRVAASLGLQAGDYVNAGQYAELVGEVRGEVESTLVSDKIGRTIGTGLTGPVPDGPPAHLEKPLGWPSLR